MNIIQSLRNLTKFEWKLWAISVIVVTLSFTINSNFQIITLIASLVGVSALIFVAKGDVLGQIMTVIFALLYAVVSYKEAYYGEMITYLFMTAPMAIFSIISWIKHPYEEGKNEVEVANLSKKQIVNMVIYSIIVTIILFFVLRYFNTANLIVSTISITTSFVASYLTFCRSSYYAIGYAMNDLVLIILWVCSALNDSSYLPMVACFIMFFFNDVYGFINWKRMKQRQTEKGEIYAEQ